MRVTLVSLPYVKGLTTRITAHSAQYGVAELPSADQASKRQVVLQRRGIMLRSSPRTVFQ